ncbi:nudC domain-containing protein 1 isoform X2 [Dendrobates tinctorius]|uniref:nudC domain-containing protein 1 isoform X2 n=1 Tax=Dendrobates tinctorius TaxID=92724 RepID=UPI003CCA1254
MEAANCSLRVNRLLLDPKFESYKLSLEPLPCYSVELDAVVAEVKLREDQYTLDHMRAYGMYNYLHCDAWSSDSVFYVDQLGRVMNIHVTLDTALGKPIEVFRFPSDVSSCDQRLCSSMHFTSPDWVTLSDGTGTLYVIRNSRNDECASVKWELKFNEELGDPFIVLHSIVYARDEVQIIDTLVLSIERDELDDKGSGFHVSLEWISIVCGQNIEPLYIWQQTAEDVTVTFRLPDDITKEHVNIQFSPDHVSISLKEQDPFLKGQLYSRIDHECSTWIIKDERSVEVTLVKRDDGCMWPEVIVGDKQGEFVADSAQCAAIAEQLMHLTSEDLNPDPEREKPPCNAQELEECDMALEDSTTLCRFDGNTMKATHVVNLGGNQFLFSLVATPQMMPCFSLRHDVDALLWQPVLNQEDNLWEHAATFNALGYVQASKQDKKFFTCAPNFCYAALCECVRRIFIYRQPTPMSTVLYNRKEGRHVGQVAKQQVASLESSDPILGFQASNERLFVLTAKKLFVIRVNTAG